LGTFITFAIIGIWHGANWTYVAFGVLQALVLMVEIFTQRKRKKFKKKQKSLGLYMGVSWFFTMAFWTFLCTIFRSESLTKCSQYLAHMFVKPQVHFMDKIESLDLSTTTLMIVLGAFLVVLFVEYLNEHFDHGLKRMPKLSVVRYVIYIGMINCVFYNLSSDQAFIYFQF